MRCRVVGVSVCGDFFALVGAVAAARRDKEGGSYEEDGSYEAGSVGSGGGPRLLSRAVRLLRLRQALARAILDREREIWVPGVKRSSAPSSSASPKKAGRKEWIRSPRNTSWFVQNHDVALRLSLEDGRQVAARDVQPNPGRSS